MPNFFSDLLNKTSTQAFLPKKTMTFPVGEGLTPAQKPIAEQKIKALSTRNFFADLLNSKKKTSAQFLGKGGDVATSSIPFDVDISDRYSQWLDVPNFNKEAKSLPTIFMNAPVSEKDSDLLKNKAIDSMAGLTSQEKNFLRNVSIITGKQYFKNMPYYTGSYADTGGIQSGEPNFILDKPYIAFDQKLTEKDIPTIQHELRHTLPITPENQAIRTGAGEEDWANQETPITRKEIILDLMKQGIGDPKQILNLVNYDENGNKIGDFTLEEIKKLQPPPQKLPQDIISIAEKLSGLKLKRDIPYYSIPLEQNADKGIHLGHTEGGVILVDNNVKGLAGETSKSNLIHEVLHQILEQNGVSQKLSLEQNEKIVKDTEFYYLSGKKDIAPLFIKLLKTISPSSQPQGGLDLNLPSLGEFKTTTTNFFANLLKKQPVFQAKVGEGLTPLQKLAAEKKISTLAQPTPVSVFKETIKGLPKATVEVGKNLLREIFTKPGARIALTYQRLKTGTEQGYVPQGKLEQFLLGKEKIKDYEAEGRDIALSFGVSPETANKMSVPIAIGFGVIDFLPPGKAVKPLAKVAKTISGTKNTNVIIKELKSVLKGTDDEIKLLAEGLKDVSNPKDVEKVLSLLRKSKSIAPVSQKAVPEELKAEKGIVAQPLAQKATKYKSAEVGQYAENTADLLYHGTGEKSAQDILRSGFKTGAELQKGEKTGLISLGTKERATHYSRGEKVGTQLPIPIKGLNLLEVKAGELYPNNLAKYTKLMDEKGYDGIRVIDDVYTGSGKTAEVLLKKEVATSQLTDFHQAVKGVKEVPAIAKGGEVISKIAKGEKELVQGEVAPRPVPPKLPKQKFPAKPKEIKEILGFGNSFKEVYDKADKISSVKDTTTFKKFKNKVADAWLNTREFVDDDWRRVKELVQRKDVKISEVSDPYSAEILMHGRMGARIEEAKDIVIKIDKDILKLSKQLGRKSDDVITDIDSFLIARHAPERNLALGEKAAGITTAEANKIVSQTDKKIIKIADEIQELNNKTLDVLLDGEVIDRKLYDTLRNKYKHHIPLNRIFEDTDDIGQAIAGRPLDVRSTGILRAKGSERKVADVITNITTNYEQAIIRAEKNRVDLATLKFARDNKGLDLFKEVKPPRIPVAKITHKEAIDEVYFKEVIDFTKSLGGKVSTKGQPGRRLGYFRKPSEVVRKTATPREVLSHEVGHFLDNKFGLKQKFYKRGETKKVAEEMIGWMEEIGESANRIKRTKERFADSFEWWLTNRALAEERLPLFSSAIENIIKDIPELKPLISIKPSGRFTIQGTPEVIFRPSVDKLLKDPTILAMREKGKPVYLKIEDTPLALALRGVNRWKVDGIMRGVQAITRFYSQLATRFNLDFFMPNKVRDLQEAVVYMASKREFGFRGATKAAMGDIRSVKSVMDYVRGIDSEGAKLYKQMKMDGGTTGGLGLSTRKSVELDINKIREINRSKPRQAAEMIVKAIDDMNTIFEDSTRLSIYKQALKRGSTRNRAAILAKEGTINFNKFGRGGPVVNAMYMFSNASIQGSVKMLRAMRNPKVAGVVIASIGTAVVAVNEWNDKVDKDWRDKISKWDRMNSLPIVFPKKDGGITYFSIPVSWGIKPIKVSMDYAIDVMAGKEDLQSSVSGILASVMEGYNPIGGTDLTSVITPTVLDMPVEVARNLGWYGGKIKPDWDINAPASIQYYTSLKDSATGKTFIQASKGLSGIGIEISPADMNYAYAQLVGGAGRFISKVANTFISIGKGEIPPAREIPFASRFLRQYTEEEVGSGSKEYGDIKKILQEQSRDRFILNQEAEDAFAQFKNLPKDQAKEMFDRLIKENPNIAKKINDIIKDEKLNLNYTDRLVKQLGVENGERAKYIKSKLDKLKTKEEKKNYYQDLIDKEIITEKVSDQIMFLLK